MVSFVCGLLFLIWITDAGILYGFMVGREPIGFVRLLRIEQVVMDYAGYSAIMGGGWPHPVRRVGVLDPADLRWPRDAGVGRWASVRVFGRFGVMMCWAFLLATVMIMGRRHGPAAAAGQPAGDGLREPGNLLPHLSPAAPAT